MQLALRNEDGTLVLANVYDNVRVYSDLLVRQLLEKFSMDHRLKAVKSVTKSIFKSLFYTEYRQAILALEAEENLLRLCARHWKAETMISQAFLRRGGGGTESKHDGHSIVSKPSSVVPSIIPKPSSIVPSIVPKPSSVVPSIVPKPSSVVPVPSSIFLKPSSIIPVPSSIIPKSSSVVLAPSSVVPSPAIPMLWDMGDIAPNAASKRPLDLSPGPKSPSASHTQKRTKDDAIVSGLRTSSCLAPAGE